MHANSSEPGRQPATRRGCTDRETQWRERRHSICRRRGAWS